MGAEFTTLADRYQLQEELGQGGSASVHRAYDQLEERWVAVKLLSPAMARHVSARRRFDREIAVLRSLSHPNVVRLYSWSSSGARTWLAMELVEGRSLEVWSRRYGPMPPRMAVEVALQISAGVQAAHALGVIHRDIKPANVLVTPTGQCKVVDFGLARGVGHERLTRTGVTMGTYGFMAPEQHDDAGTADETADVFSLGATLIALLNGRPHLEIRRGLDAISAQTPLTLARALVKATLPHPDQRYPSLAHFDQSLQRALRQLPAPPSTAPDLHIPLRYPDTPTPTNPTIAHDSDIFDGDIFDGDIFDSDQLSDRPQDSNETIHLQHFEDDPSPD